MGVANADGEPAPFHLCFEIEHAKHLHDIGRDSVLLLDDSDVAKAQGFNQRLDDGVMWHRFMG